MADDRFVGPLKVGRPPSLKDNAVVENFLASDDSAYMSGLVIPACDGGQFRHDVDPVPEDVEPGGNGGVRPGRAGGLTAKVG